MSDITDFQTLLARLDRRIRVMVLSVTLDSEGREHPELWIAPVKQPHNRLETVSDELLGKVRAVVGPVPALAPTPPPAAPAAVAP